MQLVSAFCAVLCVQYAACQGGRGTYIAAAAVGMLKNEFAQELLCSGMFRKAQILE